MEYKATKGDFEEFHGGSNYTSASFALIWCDNTSLYPQSDLEMEFDRKGIGGNSRNYLTYGDILQRVSSIIVPKCTMFMEI